MGRTHKQQWQPQPRQQQLSKHPQRQHSNTKHLSAKLIV